MDIPRYLSLTGKILIDSSLSRFESLKLYSEHFHLHSRYSSKEIVQRKSWFLSHKSGMSDVQAVKIVSQVVAIYLAQ